MVQPSRGSSGDEASGEVDLRVQRDAGHPAAAGPRAFLEMQLCEPLDLADFKIDWTDAAEVA
jgi:hypothetical protein